jgi:hypothetical protein
MSDPNSLDEVDQYRFRLIIQNTMDALWDLYSQTVRNEYTEAFRTEIDQILNP